MIQNSIVPGLKNSLYVYESYLRKYVKLEINWLELGCGHQLFPEWYNNAASIEKELITKSTKCIGFDYDYASILNHKNIKLKVRGLIEDLPFKSNTYDLVSLNMVAEHLKNPVGAFSEIKRTLKPGGICLIHTTNKYSYLSQLGRVIPRRLKKKLIYYIDGREENDIFDTYYKMNDRKKISSVAKRTGLDILFLKLTVTSPQFRKIYPINIFELLWIRMLMTKTLKNLRTNIIAVLQKPAAVGV